MTASGKQRNIKSAHAAIAGAQMHYLEAGQGSPLVLVHGLLGTASHWAPVIPLLSEDAHVYAPDALGMGASDRVAALDTRLLAGADRLIAFLDACGIQTADWVGTSHGGAVVMMLAARYPERVRSLVLHAPVNPFCAAADPLVRFYLTPLGRWFAHRAPSLPEWVHRFALQAMYGDRSRVRPGSLSGYLASLRVPGTVAYVLSILRHWKEEISALQGSLPALREVPILLLWGNRDRAVSPESGERLQRFFDRATSVILPGAGHLPHEEMPQAFAAAIHHFLQQQQPIESRPVTELPIQRQEIEDAA